VILFLNHVLDHGWPRLSLAQVNPGPSMTFAITVAERSVSYITPIATTPISQDHHH